MFIKKDGRLATFRLLGLLLLVEAAFLYISLKYIGCCGSEWDDSIVRLLRITSESNLPTWFSSTQFLVTGIFCWLVGSEYKIRKKTWKKIAWVIIAIFFFYLSMDDGSRFHERVASATARWIERIDETSYFVALVKSNPSYNWQLLLLPIFALFGLFMTVFLMRDFYSWGVFILFCAGIGLFVIAIGLDFIDGLQNGYDWLLDNTDYTFKQIQYTSRAIEEFIELVGASLILLSILKQWTWIRLEPTLTNKHSTH